MVEAQEVIDLLTMLFDFKVEEETDEYWTFSGRHIPTNNKLQKLEVDSLVSRLNSYPALDASRVTPTSYELLTADEGGFRFPSRFMMGDEYRIDDSSHDIVYRLGDPSIELVTGMLLGMNLHADSQMLRRVRRSFIIAMPSYRRRDAQDSGNPLDMLSLVFRRTAALRVDSQKERAPKFLKDCINAFIFQMAYNLDLSLISVHEVESVFPSRGVDRSQRSGGHEVEAPKLNYDEELVGRYISATASRDVVSSYLGYYHILENKFESVYGRFIIDKVRGRIVEPGFSVRRDGDISGLIKEVSKLIRERQNESSSFDEKKALQLTLKSHVDINRLRSRLQGSGMDVYVESTSVPFSGGDIVNFDAKPEDFFGTLANRIYKTRNSVVHAKSGEKLRFKPRKDDSILRKEVDLLRAVSEEILIEQASLLH